MIYSVSIIIPAYNEEENIEEAINICVKTLPRFLDDFEVIVVDDGSQDKTLERAKELGTSIPQVRIYEHPKNMGLGAAIATGVAHAKKELIFVTPADLQFDIAELQKFLPLIESADIVIGFRTNREDSAYRRIVTFTKEFLSNILFGLKVKDLSWVKLFRREVFLTIPITSPGFFWDVEVLVQAQRNSFIIKEVGVHTYKRKAGTSSGGKPVAAIKSFFELLTFWLSGR